MGNLTRRKSVADGSGGSTDFAALTIAAAKFSADESGESVDCSFTFAVSSTLLAIAIAGRVANGMENGPGVVGTIGLAAFAVALAVALFVAQAAATCVVFMATAEVVGRPALSVPAAAASVVVAAASVGKAAAAAGMKPGVLGAVGTATLAVVIFGAAFVAIATAEGVVSMAARAFLRRVGKKKRAGPRNAAGDGGGSSGAGEGNGIGLPERGAADDGKEDDVDGMSKTRFVVDESGVETIEFVTLVAVAAAMIIVVTRIFNTWDRGASNVEKRANGLKLPS